MSEDDALKALWQGQPQEEMGPMSTETLRARATGLRAVVRRRNMIEYIAGAAVILLFGSWALQDGHPLVRLGAALIAAGCALMMLILALRAGGGAEPDAGAAVLDYHRAQLIRQRDALRSVWLWYVAPFVPGLILFNLGVFLGGANPVMAALSAGLCVAVFAGVIWLNLQGARRLQKAIDALG